MLIAQLQQISFLRIAISWDGNRLFTIVAATFLAVGLLCLHPRPLPLRTRLRMLRSTRLLLTCIALLFAVCLFLYSSLWRIPRHGHQRRRERSCELRLTPVGEHLYKHLALFTRRTRAFGLSRSCEQRELTPLPAVRVLGALPVFLLNLPAYWGTRAGTRQGAERSCGTTCYVERPLTTDIACLSLQTPTRCLLPATYRYRFTAASTFLMLRQNYHVFRFRRRWRISTGGWQAGKWRAAYSRQRARRKVLSWHAAGAITGPRHLTVPAGTFRTATTAAEPW